MTAIMIIITIIMTIILILDKRFYECKAWIIYSNSSYVHSANKTQTGSYWIVITRIILIEYIYFKAIATAQ